jgi:hypothetical protein
MTKLIENIIFCGLLPLLVIGCYRNVPDLEISSNGGALDSTRIFDQYDFNSGEYELFGVYWSDFERNSLADSLGTFAITDTSLLNQIQSNWKLEPQSELRCGYDYKLYLTKGDSLISTSFLNILCESIVVDGVGYQIGRDKIASLYGKTDSIETIRVVFYAQDLAVDYLKGMRADSTVFVLDHGGYVWEKYIGYFEFTYTNTEIKDSKKALAEARAAIEKKYNSTDFELESVGSNTENGVYKIRAYCHEEFSRDFKLYPVRKAYTFIVNYSMTGFWRQ